MSLTVIYGRKGCGKSEYCLSSAHQDFLAGNRAFIIVPEQFSHIKESELIKKVGFLSDEIKATSFKRMAYSVISASSLKEPVDRVKKSMLMSRAVNDCKDKLLYFKDINKKQGFIKVILDIVADFKRSGLTVDDITEFIQNENDDLPLFKMKLSELSLIYSKYQELLSGRYTDDDDACILLAQEILKMEDLSKLHIYIDEFFRFTIAEQEIIKAFLIKGASVTVSLCTPSLNETKTSAFAPVITTYNKLSNIAKEVGKDVKTKKVSDINFRTQESKELTHLENEFLKFPPKEDSSATEDISLFIASDIYSELIHLASNIKKIVKETGARYKEISIICGKPDEYKSLIKTVFSSYEIPVFIDTKRELMSHSVIIMIFSVFEILINGYDTRYVLQYIKSGYSGLSENEVDFFENYILSTNIGKKDWLSDERLLKTARSVFEEAENLAEKDVEKTEKLLKIRDKVFSPLLNLKEKISKSRKVKNRVEAFYDFFEEISLRSAIEIQTEKLLGKKESQRAKEYAEVYNILISAFSSLCDCMGDEVLGIEKMYNILSAGFAECSIGIIPPVNDGVFFGDLNRSIARNAKALFVIGASDGTFPPSAQAESVINDDERIYLSKKGIELAPDTKKMMFDYNFMVYNTINIAKQKIFFSYPVSDIKGEGLRPSVLFTKIKKIFPNLYIESDVDGKKQAPEKFVFSKKSAYNYLIGKENINGEDEKILEHLKKDESYNKKLKSIEKASQYKKDAQIIDNDVIKKLYKNGLRGSVSSFETYSKCPFSYFISYGLRAKERKLFDIDTPDFGSLLHNVIDVFSKQVKESGKSFVKLSEQDAQNIALGVLDNILDKMFIKKLYDDKKFNLLVKRLKKFILRAVWAICEHIRRGEFEPCAFEVSFDENGDMPPVKIDLPTGETITFVGKIDRVDKYLHNGELYIKIIDYKTGQKSFSLSDIYNRLSLQLCVYLTAVTENGEALLGSKPKTAGMFYFRLSDDPIKTVADKNISNDDFLKQYKMSGMVLDNSDIIKAIDNGISGYSKIIPVQMNAEGEIVKSRSKVATMEQIGKMKSYIKKVSAQIGREILSGKVEISPCSSGGEIPCKYCKFHSICGFDINTDNYRRMPNLKDDDVWELLNEERQI